MSLKHEVSNLESPLCITEKLSRGSIHSDKVLIYSLFLLQAERVYDMITDYESIEWSGSVNCQQYVRQLVESLGLGMPTDLQLAGDTLPPWWKYTDGIRPTTIQMPQC
jgi:hypothetical protein